MFYVYSKNRMKSEYKSLIFYLFLSAVILSKCVNIIYHINYTDFFLPLQFVLARSCLLYARIQEGKIRSLITID